MVFKKLITCEKGGNQMRAKTLLLVAVAICLAVSFSVPGQAAEKEKWVVFSVKNIVNPFWKACWVGAQRAAADPGKGLHDQLFQRGAHVLGRYLQ